MTTTAANTHHHHTPDRRRQIVVGVTGASGAAYAQRTISHLLQLGHDVHLVVTDYGKRLLNDELGTQGPIAANLHTLAGIPEADPDLSPLERSRHARQHRLTLHPAKDVGASLGSGSFRHDGMIVIPCSSNSLGAIASGYGDHLLHRAAAVALKERFPLVLVHREAPLNRVDLKNCLHLHDAGAVIMPANPGFYLHPQSLDDIVDFVVARALDQLNIPHTLSKRWNQHLADQGAAKHAGQPDAPGD